MKPLALALLAILVVVLRRREPDRAVARHWHEDDDGLQPGDPYPASLLLAGPTRCGRGPAPQGFGRPARQLPKPRRAA